MKIKRSNTITKVLSTILAILACAGVAMGGALFMKNNESIPSDSSKNSSFSASESVSTNSNSSVGEFVNTDLTTYDTTTALGYEWLGGYTLNAVDGKISVNATRCILVNYIEIAELESIEIADGYQITWLVYNENHVYIGNGANTYPALPAGGVWMASGENLQASTITDWNADSVYVRIAIMPYDGTEVTTFLTNCGLVINMK